MAGFFCARDVWENVAFGCRRGGDIRGLCLVLHNVLRSREDLRDMTLVHRVVVTVAAMAGICGFGFMFLEALQKITERFERRS